MKLNLKKIKLPNLRYLKQEMLLIPVLCVLVELIRQLIIHLFPGTPMFDPASEFETFIVKTWQFLWISCATWLMLRIVFPKVHKFSVHMFNDGFDSLSIEKRLHVAICFYAIFFFGLIFLFTGGGVKGATVNEINFKQRYTETELRQEVVSLLKTQLYVRELTGNNDGVEVEKYLAHVGLKKGNSWCVAFCSWILSQFGIPNPMSGWSPNWAKVKDRVNHALPGDILTFFYNNLNRVGHGCFVVGESNVYYSTIEGNTGLTGSNDGTGVHAYFRDKRKVYAITNYISRLFA